MRLFQPGILADGCRDNPCLPVDLSNNVVRHVGEVHITGLVEPNLIRLPESRLSRRTAVPGVPLLAVSGDHGKLPRLQVKSPYDVIVDVAKIKRTVRSDNQTIRII